jgi:hypothetical protein
MNSVKEVIPPNLAMLAPSAFIFLSVPTMENVVLVFLLASSTTYTSSVSSQLPSWLLVTHPAI